MRATTTLLSFLLFVVSGAIFSALTVDIANYGYEYWGFLQYGIYTSMAIIMVVSAFATIILNIKN